MEQEKQPSTTNTVTWGPVTGAVYFYDRRSKSNGKYPLKIRITYKRDRLYINTGYDLTPEQWVTYNSGRGDVYKARTAIQAQMKVIGEHVEDLNKTAFTLEALRVKLGRGKKSDVLTAFKARIHDLRKAGRISNAVIYECALNSLKDHIKGRSIEFKKITKPWLEKYDAGMEKDGKSTTTRSMYLRCLRAIINESGAASAFGKGKYQIKSGGGRKMALTRQQINNVMMTYPLLQESTTDKMRDLFFFTYMCCGINIKDLIRLRWNDIINGEIQFSRVKTARTESSERVIAAPILPQMQSIMDKWGQPDSKYIFGYITDKMSADEVFLVSKNLTRLMNKHLNIITKATGLPRISTYTARHSFASNLLRAGAPVELISGQMGHSRITTTQAYLAGFDADDRRKYNETLTGE